LIESKPKIVDDCSEWYQVNGYISGTVKIKKSEKLLSEAVKPDK
jgi:hypothetical protein